MPPKLYATRGSPAVRGTLLLVSAIDLEIELKVIDITNGEHVTPEYLKLNPQHTVPTLEDDGFIIWDSHAINIYLVEKYAKDDSFYPTDAQKRAIIHQRLHFNSGVIFPHMYAILEPIIWKGAKTIPREKTEAVLIGYGFLEKFLEGNQYVAGDNLSIADFNLVACVTTSIVFVPIDEKIYPNITAWLRRMKSLPYYKKGNQEGLDQFTAFIGKKLA